MALIATLDGLVAKGHLTDEEVDEWMVAGDDSSEVDFFGKDEAAAVEYVRRIAAKFVEWPLNDPDVSEAGLRRKIKYCILLNIFAMYRKARPVLLEVLDKLSSIFEGSIDKEGALEFDALLGRMSEHVLVLLCRVTDYQITAPAVNEFTENRTQFSIQLLVAILLKDPPYELELRCCCVRGLMGFTQPQTFFRSGDAVAEHTCQEFTKKVNFIRGVLLRVEAVAVAGRILSEDLQASQAVSPMIQGALHCMMQCVMNVFKYASVDAETWRHHVLLASDFVDVAVLPYLGLHTASLHRALLAQPPKVDAGVIRGMTLALSFSIFATYRLGKEPRLLRPSCGFLHYFFQVPVRVLLTDSKTVEMSTQLCLSILRFMCNIDALGGDDELTDIVPQLTSAELTRSLETFLKRELISCGAPLVAKWRQGLQKVDNVVMVSHESTTFTLINRMLTTLEAELQLSGEAGGAGSSAPRSSAALPSPAQGAPAAPAASAPGQEGALGGTSAPAGRGFTSEVDPKMNFYVPVPGQSVPVRATQPPPKENASYSVDVQVPKKPVVVNELPAGVDRSLLCELTGNVMKKPVTTPSGHTFEEWAILQWIQQNGSVCPVTGETLRAEMLKPNREIASKIMRQVVMESMSGQAQEDDSDLYNF